MLRAVAKNLWVAEQPLRMLGVNYGARMTVIKLASGNLTLISPIKADEALIKQVKALGEIEAIIAPNSFHHLFAKPWRDATPKASIYAVHQLEKKRPDLAPMTIMDEMSSPWPGDIDWQLIKGSSFYSEMVLLHRASQSIIVTDLCFNMQHPQGFYDKIALRIYGAYKNFGPTKFAGLLVKDRSQLGQAVEAISRWDFTRVVVAHGDILENTSPAFFRSRFEKLVK